MSRAVTSLALVLCVLAVALGVSSSKKRQSDAFDFDDQVQDQRGAYNQHLKFFSKPISRPKFYSSGVISPQLLSRYGAGQLPPPNECSNYFRYTQGPDGRTAGQILIEYTGPPTNYHNLQVNMSVNDELLPGEALNISLVSNAAEVLHGRLFKFWLRFPLTRYNFIPWIVYINFNGRVLCTANGPAPTPHLPLVLMWSQLEIHISGGSDTFPPPTTQRPPHCPACPPINCPTEQTTTTTGWPTWPPTTTGWPTWPPPTGWPTPPPTGWPTPPPTVWPTGWPTPPPTGWPTPPPTGWPTPPPTGCPTFPPICPWMQSFRDDGNSPALAESLLKDNEKGYDDGSLFGRKK